MKPSPSGLKFESRWEELYDNSPLVTPFQSWAWLFSWWESYGEGYEPRLVTVRDDKGLLVGLVPLMLEHRPAFGRLLFIGTGIKTFGHLNTSATITAVDNCMDSSTVTPSFERRTEGHRDFEMARPGKRR